jgi:hypothetical protein
VGINVVVWAYVLGTITLLVTKQVRLSHVVRGSAANMPLLQGGAVPWLHLDGKQ